MSDVRNRDLGSFIKEGEESRGGNVTLDLTNAVLLDGMDVCLVNSYSGVYDKTQRGVTEGIRLAMQLDGRVNKTTDRASVLYILDEDGAAAIISELMSLATRIGPEFATRLMERITVLQEEGEIVEV